MDNARPDIITVCSRFARMQLRLRSAEYAPPGSKARELCLRDLQPKSCWLDAGHPNVALTEVACGVAVALAHLLAIADSAHGPIDARAACLALQHIQCNSPNWVPLPSRLAVRLHESPYVKGNGGRSAKSCFRVVSPVSQFLHTRPRAARRLAAQRHCTMKGLRWSGSSACGRSRSS